MNAEPARIVRVTGFNDDFYAWDEHGQLWSREVRQYKTMWILLPSLHGIFDFYVHVVVSDEGVVDMLRTKLRALDVAGKLWELRWHNGEYCWGEINLEAR